MERLLILYGKKSYTVCRTARKLDGKVSLVSALGIKRAAMSPKLQLFVAVIMEVQMPSPLTLHNALNEFVDRRPDSWILLPFVLRFVLVWGLR